MYFPGQRAVTVGELPWAQQGAKEVSSRGDSFQVFNTMPVPGHLGTCSFSWFQRVSGRSMGCGHHLQCLKTGNGASQGIPDEDLVTWTPPWWNAGMLQVISSKMAKRGMGQKFQPQSEQRMELGWNGIVPQEWRARPRDPVKSTVLRTWQKTLTVSLWCQKCRRTEPNWTGEEENCCSNEGTATHK